MAKGLRVVGRWFVAPTLSLFLSCGGSSSGSGIGSGDLSGVWDAVGSRLGKYQTYVTVTIDPGRFVVENKSIVMTATATGDNFEVSYFDVGPPTDRFFLDRTSAPPISLGAFPINFLVPGKRSEPTAIRSMAA